MNALEVLQRLGNRDLVEQVHMALLEVSAEVVTTGNPGKVQVNLTVSHPDGSDQAVIVVTEEVKRTHPKRAAKGSMFYALDYELHDRDPRQTELPDFRLVQKDGSAELRTPEEAGEAMREAGE